MTAPSEVRAARARPAAARWRLLGLLPWLLAALGCTPAWLCPGGSKLGDLGVDPPQGRDLAAKTHLRLLVFGDSGKVEPLLETGAGMARACAGNCDLAVVLGDNVYWKGPSRGPANRTLRRHVLDPLSGLGPLELWAVLGNHDYLGCPAVEVGWDGRQDRPGGPVWRLPGVLYRVPGLPDWLSLVAVDTEYLLRADLPRRQVYLRELEDLACGARGWNGLLSHHPLWSTGHHGREAELEQLRSWLEPVLERCEVDVVLSGHEHHQEILDLGGYVQVIEGAASKLRVQDPSAMPEAKKASRVFYSVRGFALIDWRPELLKVILHDASGLPLGEAWELARRRPETEEGR